MPEKVKLKGSFGGGCERFDSVMRDLISAVLVYATSTTTSNFRDSEFVVRCLSDVRTLF